MIASGNVKPGPGDMPDKATCIGKPFNDRMLQQHLTEKLPDNRQLEQLKQRGVAAVLRELMTLRS